MIFPEVKNLYKYTSINENSLSILIKEEFWFAKPSTFNDPLDCGISLFNSNSKEQFLIKANKALANAKKTRKPGKRNPELSRQIKAIEGLIRKVKQTQDEGLRRNY